MNWIYAIALASMAGIVFMLAPIAGSIAGTVIGIGFGIMVLKVLFDIEFSKD